MATILIVDDDAVDRELVRRSLKDIDSLEFIEAEDGEKGLACVNERHPDMVLTDLRMPKMTGLELVREIQEENAHVPTILMTSQGSERIAVEALREGAMSYVPKSHIKEDLADSVMRALDLLASRRSRDRLMGYMGRCETHFELENDPSLIAPLASYFQENLERIRFGHARDRNQIAVAIVEALSNSMIHGNLEVGSELRQQSHEAYNDMIAKRRDQQPYAGRRVRCEARETPELIEYTFHDEGPGFDPDALPDPSDPENVLNVSGRGVMLIRTFMSDVVFDRGGATITMRRTAA